MYESNKKLTVQELKDLYPGIQLLDGYDLSFVGVVSAPNDQYVPVYDTFKLIDIISRKNFKNKEDVGKYFNDIVSKAKDKDGFGPLFLQTVKLRIDRKLSDSVIDELFSKEDKSEDKDGEIYSDDLPSWIEEASDHEFFIPDNDEKDRTVWLDEDHPDYDSDSDSNSDSQYDEIIEESDYENDYDDDDKSFLQISVSIGTNDPEDCKITSSVKDVKEAIKLLFPNLPRLDMVREMKFYFDNIEDLEDLEDDEEDLD